MIRTRSTLQAVIQILHAGNCRVEWMVEGSWPRRFGMIGSCIVTCDCRVELRTWKAYRFLSEPVGRDKTGLIFWGSMNEVVLERD